MTPNQGDNPNAPRGRQSAGGNNYQGRPTRPPRQPQQNQPQGQPVQQGQQTPGGQQGGMGAGGPTAPPTQMPPGPPQGATGQPMSQQPMQQGPTGHVPTAPQQAGASAQQSAGVPPQQAGVPPQQMAGQGGRARGRRRGGPQLQAVTIDDIVATDVVTAQRDTPVATVVAKMNEEDVGSVVVVEDDSPVGVLTDRKIALALENTPDVANKQAGELVSGDLVTATTDASVFDALEQLSDEEIRRLPIVDDDGRLKGIVTLDDLTVLLASELGKIGDTIAAQSPRL